MNKFFSSNLLNLRKEKALSQKEVANELGVSQALLSHYEKGIRECGLDFVAKTAKYYGVSSDYLLGLKEKEHASAKVKSAEEKMLDNSINIIFLLLENFNSKNLSNEVISYLSTANYTILRQLSTADELYKVDNDIFSAMSTANMTINKAKIKKIIKDENLNNKMPKLKTENKKYNDVKKLVALAEKKMKEDI